jgi:hypothetical protein
MENPAIHRMVVANAGVLYLPPCSPGRTHDPAAAEPPEGTRPGGEQLVTELKAFLRCTEARTRTTFQNSIGRPLDVGSPNRVHQQPGECRLCSGSDPDAPADRTFTGQMDETAHPRLFPRW